MLVAAFLAASIAVMPCDERRARAVIDDVNRHRRSSRERALALDANLASVALERATDLLRRHYFAHVSPDGTTAIDALRANGYRFSYAGENLALADTIEVADAALFASPEHRENILEPHYRHIGVAVVDGPDGQLVVQIFSD